MRRSATRFGEYVEAGAAIQSLADDDGVDGAAAQQVQRFVAADGDMKIELIAQRDGDIAKRVDIAIDQNDLAELRRPNGVSAFARRTRCAAFACWFVG